MNHPHPGLPYPAKLAKKTLRIVALGGLGEIGRNMTVFEYEGRLLIVDCGVLFPGDDQPGIDLILPDFSYLKDRMNDIEAIFLTHGHEDHIGAVPYLLRERSDIRIIGSQLTLAFVAPKLKERRITAPMTQVKAGQVEQVGPFTLEFVTVNHSIPDSLAVAIKTPAGVILHTGDFKMDKMPLDGKVTDLETFARLGKEGYVGRSMIRNMKLAEDLGYLKVPNGLVVDYKDIDSFGDKIVLVCTGSQGEPLAALSRIANGDHEIQVGKGDTVVLASSLIPGNEKSVYRVINELTRFGAHVVHKGNAMVHVSGHASAGELLHCYEVVKPKNVLPVHGEWRHMRANADLAMKSGLSEHNVVIAENGITIDVADGHADISGSVPCGYVYVDGQSVGEITESSLKDRRILGDEGFISVVVVIDSQSGKIVAGPDIHARGFTEDKTLFDDVKGDIEKALSKAVAGGFNGTHQLSQVVRKTIGSWVGEEHRRKPMIIPLVVEV